MAKASRSRKNKSTRKVRKMRGGANKNNNNNNNNATNNMNNKEKKAAEEEPIKLRGDLMDAFEEGNINTLKIFIEQQQYRAILQEGLMCLENKNKLF